MKIKARLFLILIFSMLFFGISMECNSSMRSKHVRFNQSYSKNDIKEQNLVIHENSIDISYDSKKLIGLNDFGEYSNDLTGKGVTVAILDTGLYPNHETFTNDGKSHWNKRIVAFYDEAVNGTSGTPYDIEWHGTWVASILGGKSKDYKGVAPDVNFVVLKVFKYIDGELGSNLLLIEDAVNWIIDNKEKYNIKIASMSFGLKPEENNLEIIDKLNEIVEKIVDEGIFVVAAAGNYGAPSSNNDMGTISSPGSAKSVIAVGGVDSNGDLFSLSGQGPTHEGVVKPDVCAPAVNIYGANTEKSPNDYAYHSGTSASTPFVSGLAALMLEKNNSLTPLDLKNIISLTSVRTIDPYTIKDNKQGWGIIQGQAALSALDNPMRVSYNSVFDFALNESFKVLCQPIILEPHHHFFELVQLGNARAEMYLFEANSDENGNPLLISHSINELSKSFSTKRMGAFITETQNYYLVVKLIHGTGEGNFQVKLIIEYRIGLIITLTIINSIALIYVKKFYKSKIE